MANYTYAERERAIAAARMLMSKDHGGSVGVLGSAAVALGALGLFIKLGSSDSDSAIGTWALVAGGAAAIWAVIVFAIAAHQGSQLRELAARYDFDLTTLQ